MNHHYRDILDRIAVPPLWWDEHAVPRYCAFGPREVANIYADECCLLLIECQGCGTEFKVGFSSSLMDRARSAYEKLAIVDKVVEPTGEMITAASNSMRLSSQIINHTIHYGDPPNFCCGSGATMNSIPVRVLEYWQQEQGGRGFPGWEQVYELEIEIKAEWAKNRPPR